MLKFELKDKREEVPIVFLGDVHYGNEDCDWCKFNDYLEWIRKNNAYVILMGDLLEVCNPNHMPQTMWNQKIDPTKQKEDMLTFLDAINENIIGMISGNHELRIFNQVGIDIVKDMSEELETNYLKDGDYIIIKTRGPTYTIAAFHGSGGSLTPYHQLKKALEVYEDMDLIAIGHMHQLFHETKYKYKIENGERIKKEIHLIRTGGFLEYPAYAMRRFMPLANVGAPVVWLNTKEKKIRIELGI